MMRLPDDSIGISDLLNWRECPQRMEHGMKRHTEEGEAPGSTNWTNAYGSAVHEVIHHVETGDSEEDAITKVWAKYGGYLDPEHVALLHEDLASYRGATPIGMEVVAAEVDRKVPLFMFRGRQIYFRFKIDALYRRAADHTVFYQRDYKSSAHQKWQKEVDADLQMWAYNWALFELYPECVSLIQSYEQLKFGNLKTSKNAEQRAQMKEWLIKTATAVLEDEKMEPKQNEWCPWCPLVITCDQTKRATTFWKGRLSVLAPKTTEGRKTKIEFLDEGLELEEMIEEVLPVMIGTRKHLDAAEKALKTLISELPSEERERLGWRLSDRTTKTFSPEGLRTVHEALGDDFYEVVTLSKAAVDTVVGKSKKGEPLSPQLKSIHDAELSRVSATTVVAK